MAQVKYYTILAGRKEPAKVLQGTLSKTTGMPQGTPQKVQVVVGSIVIPNYSLAWGKRVHEKSKGTDRSCSVTDPLYMGNIKFLPYGEDGGEAIPIRYLPSSNSLDKQYQDTVQKLKPQETDAVIVLQQGLNNFNEQTMPMLVEMIKHHGLNHNNKSKSTENFEYDFVEFDSSTRNTTRIQAIETKRHAEAYILEAQKDKETIRIYAHIFNIDPLLDDGVIMEQLLDKAEQLPGAFVQAINDHMHGVEILLDDAEAMGLIEFKDDKVMLKEEGKTTTLLKDVEGKDKDRSLWIVQQVLSNVKVFDAMVALQKSFKHAQLTLV